MEAQFVRDYTTQGAPRVRPRPRCRMAAVNFNQSVFISPGIGGGAARWQTLRLSRCWPSCRTRSWGALWSNVPPPTWGSSGPAGPWRPPSEPRSSTIWQVIKNNDQASVSTPDCSFKTMCCWLTSLTASTQLISLNLIRKITFKRQNKLQMCFFIHSSAEKLLF